MRKSSYVYWEPVFPDAKDPKTYDKAQLAEWFALLNAHGVVLGAKKCLPPSTRSEWLGLTIDAESMTISVDDEKKRAIKGLIGELDDEAGPACIGGDDRREAEFNRHADLDAAPDLDEALGEVATRWVRGLD